MIRILGLLLATAIILPLSSHSLYAKRTHSQSCMQCQQPESAQIQLFSSEGQPLAGAMVMVGYAKDDPFSGNIMTSDSQGYFNLPAAWNQPLPVTVSADQHVRTTFPGVEPTSQALEINIADGPEKIEIKGETTDFGRLRRDGKVDFGLVIPAITRKELLHFDISKVMSSQMDTIRVATKSFDIPSNLTLPDQTESYIIPITFDKPQYRMYVRQPGQYQMVATHGQFPLKQVINDLRDGKSIFEVVNHFSFVESGKIVVDAQKSIGNKDIPVNQVTFNQTINVSAPSYHSDYVMMALAMVEEDSQLYPSDLKRVEANGREGLQFPTNGDRYVLSALMPNTSPFYHPPVEQQNDWWALEDTSPIDFSQLFKLDQNEAVVGMGQLSFVLQSAHTEKTPSFLPHVAKPQVTENRILLSPPSEVDGVAPVATYVILSEVEVHGDGKVKSETRTRLWEFVASEWLSEVALPELPLGELNGNKTHRWEVLYLGQRIGARSKKGAHFLDTITHVTRNSVDF